MLSYPKVLLLSSDEAETRKWEEMFREHAEVKSIRNLSELERNLGGDTFDVLVCGWAFQTGTWSDALNSACQQCPDLPVIIYSGTGGEDEWVKVLEAGAFDLVVAPYQRRTVLPVLEQAVATSEARRFHRTGSFITARAS